MISKICLIGQFPSKSTKASRIIGLGFIFCQIRQSQSKLFEKVFEAGLQDQNTLLNKTLTRFLIENFDRVNGPKVK